MTCPRCDTPLAETQDLQHTTRFSYYRCVRGHGRRWVVTIASTSPYCRNA